MLASRVSGVGSAASRRERERVSTPGDECDGVRVRRGVLAAVAGAPAFRAALGELVVRRSGVGEPGAVRCAGLLLLAYGFTWQRVPCGRFRGLRRSEPGDTGRARLALRSRSPGVLQTPDEFISSKSRSASLMSRCITVPGLESIRYDGTP